MTKDIIEHLLFVSKNQILLRFILKDCGILNETGRIWQPIYHKEFESYEIGNFDIIHSSSSYNTIYLIGEKNSRVYPTIKIIGNNWEYFLHGSRKLVSDIISSINIKEFLPQPFSKSLTIYMENENFDPFNPNIEKKILNIRENYVVDNINSLKQNKIIGIRDLLLKVFP